MLTKYLFNNPKVAMKHNKGNLVGNQAQQGTGEVLSDSRRRGKKRAWREYKQKSLAIAVAYSFFDELIKYANQISQCGSWLKFSACPHGHHKRLISAFFCRCRLCVLCQWRKSLAMFHQVFTLIHAHRKRYKSDIPLLLTLTVPNVSGDELKNELDMMQTSFKKLMKRRGVQRAVRSWFRALEVTYNSKRMDYHPHYHVLLLVPKNYFDKKYDLYIEQSGWLKMWQESIGKPEITQVDIRRVKKRKEGAIEGITAEVAKYATKPDNYVNRLPTGEYTADKDVINILHHAMKGRRLVAFGGLFAKLRKEMKLKDIEKTNLVNITDEEQPCCCPVCQSTLREEMYKWHIGSREYIG